ncbi:MAG: 50S ribosomal protein L25 [Dehalococcoidia bacterium]|nr:50S ribosomal protein L25 [Dehalococcoidia bacterium]
MAERVSLAAAPRTVLGKQVRRLRRQGVLPGNVYGKGISSVAVELDARTFARTIKAHGVRSMFELAIDGENAVRHVVLRGLTRAGGVGEPIHVDFYQVDLNRPIQAHVPLHLEGVAPAVRDLAGTLIQSLEAVTIRSLPLAIPDAIVVDVGMLARFDVSLTVADVKPPAGVEILNDLAIVVATVTPPRIRVETEEEQAE